MSSIRLKKNMVERKRKSLMKIGIFAAVLLILCMAAYLSVDRVAPVFDFTDAASVYSVTEGEELDINIFMQGVKATDKVDGDLTDRIAIKSIRQNADSSIAVIYCVRDNAGNLTTEERIYNLQGAGGSISVSGNDEPEVTTDAETSGGDASSAEESSDEGDITDESALPGEEPAPEPEPEPEPATEPEPVTEPETEPEPEPATEPEPEPVQNTQTPVVILTASEAHIAVGTGFNYVSYIAEMWDDVDSSEYLTNNIWIENYELIDVNTSGVYNLIFHVIDSEGNISEGQPFTLYIEW